MNQLFGSVQVKIPTGCAGLFSIVDAVTPISLPDGFEMATCVCRGEAPAPMRQRTSGSAHPAAHIRQRISGSAYPAAPMRQRTSGSAYPAAPNSGSAQFRQRTCGSAQLRQRPGQQGAGLRDDSPGTSDRSLSMTCSRSSISGNVRRVFCQFPPHTGKPLLQIFQPRIKEGARFC